MSTVNAIATKVKSSPVAKEILLYASGFLFMFVCANIKILLPISPIPVTMHTFAIAVLGCLLPFRISMTCLGVYLFEGAIGSPLFGMPLMYSAAGYYAGMVMALFFLSHVARKTRLPLILNLVISTLIIWAFGVFHLQHLMGLQKALMVGVLPFIVGSAFKICAAYSLIRSVKHKFEHVV